MQWTKWAAWQIFGNALERAMPNWAVFLNIARPTKSHRCLLHLLFDSLTMLLCCLMLAVETAKEDITADERSLWALFEEMATATLSVEPVVAIFAVCVARLLRFACEKIFFSYEVSVHRLVTTKAGQLETMMYWHELAQMGKWICIVIIIFSTVGTVIFAALQPQPRAAYVVRTFIVATVLSHLLLPFADAAATTIVLCNARMTRVFDGLLTVFPGLMDFLSVGVVHPDFLRWRVDRMVTELEQMSMVYNSEFLETFAKRDMHIPYPTMAAPQSPARNASAIAPAIADSAYDTEKYETENFGDDPEPLAIQN
eukprot:TRINITY_DN16395_c0_g1_i2.p1 TRINITY_DN16395_c0_g1~~TRINITY_DN16395_c0_g1_i2.p1  ORF type:complete len:312 (+),score=59.72 TRINITY_DN16395_c0_g1_i2:867-1802(+)